jgi:hypothetical protein
MIKITASIERFLQQNQVARNTLEQARLKHILVFLRNHRMVKDQDNRIST